MKASAGGSPSRCDYHVVIRLAAERSDVVAAEPDRPRGRYLAAGTRYDKNRDERVVDMTPALKTLVSAQIQQAGPCAAWLVPSSLRLL